MAILDDKFEALKSFLIETGAATEEELANETVESTYNEGESTFEVIGNAYMVLTDEEADAEARERIEEDLWAFNADFILEHTAFYRDSSDKEDKEFTSVLKQLQGNIAESANPIVKALIEDLDEFIEDAIDADGRGQFISWYDGREYEEGDFFIYRID